MNRFERRTHNRFKESISADTKVTLIAYSENDINLLKVAKDLSVYSMVQIEDGFVAATLSAIDAQKAIEKLNKFDILKSDIVDGRIDTEAEPISKKDLMLLTNKEDRSGEKEKLDVDSNRIKGIKAKEPKEEEKEDKVDEFLESVYKRKRK